MKTKKNNILSKDILEILKKTPDKLYNLKQIKSILKIKGSNLNKELQSSIDLLVKENNIEKKGHKSYRYASKKIIAEGYLDLSYSGNGYVICDNLEQDVFIPCHKMGSALNGDKVSITYKKSRNNKPRGEIKSIIKRKNTHFVGVIKKNKGVFYLIPNDSRVSFYFIIDKKNLNGAKENDAVLIESIKFGKDSMPGEGKVSNIFGPKDTTDAEVDMILQNHQIPTNFSEEALKSLKKIDFKISPQEVKKREDFRKHLTFTIDPTDAKDFDDAISFKILENGHFEIGVHIADVTHYLEANSPLDLEAQERANSVYLVNKVIPMLPEILCNEVCSLKPYEDKLTFSVIFDMDKNADILKFRCVKTIIHSKKRYTYEDVQQVLDQEKEDIHQDVLKTLNNLAKKLREKRSLEQSIFFEKKEVSFILNKKSEPVGINFKSSNDANKLIEEFMLLANKKVSEYMQKKFHNNPSIFRIHPAPDYEKINDFKSMVKKFGYDININSESEIRKSINILLEEIQDKPEKNMISILAIRSMSKASYSTNNIGHFGLSFEKYSHFTSPIRRYADVLLHRLIYSYQENIKVQKELYYEEICKHITKKEVDSISAERESIKYMQVKYLENKIDQVFAGTISGVSDIGVFIELDENGCEGLVRSKNIKDDFYYYDSKSQALIGKKNSKKYQLGQKVFVQLIKTDSQKRQIDFIISDVYEDSIKF